MNHDRLCARHWDSLYSEFAEFQFALCDVHGAVVAAGFSIPVAWSGRTRDLPSGLDGVLEQGAGDRARRRRPTTLSALLAVVAPEARAQGLSGEILSGMKAIAERHALRELIAPVRPTLKHRYPLIPMGRYARWTRYGRRPVRSMAPHPPPPRGDLPGRGGPVHGGHGHGAGLHLLEKRCRVGTLLALLLRLLQLPNSSEIMQELRSGDYSSQFSVRKDRQLVEIVPAHHFQCRH